MAPARITANLYIILPALVTLLLTAMACQKAGDDPKPEEPVEEASLELTWAQWRGPSGLGVSGEESLPTVWSADSANIRWRVDLPGVGNSSPIVAGGRVFLTAAVEETTAPDEEAEQKASQDSRIRRIVICLDLENGETLWTTEVFSTGGGRLHRLNTLAAPTPVTDGRLIYVYFGSVLAALDLNGQVVWTNEVDADCYEHWKYGDATSPVLVDDLVIVVQDQEAAGKGDVGWLAAFDKATGQQVWRNEWTETCCSYATPIVIDRDSGTELLFPHAGYFASYDPETGKENWRQEYEINQPVASPVITRNIIPYTGGAHQVRATVGIGLPNPATEPNPTVLWQIKNLASETSSPVALRGKLYYVTQKGIMYCVDARTGKQHWKRRLSRSGYHASLVAGDDKIYATSNHGLTVVVAAAKKFSLLSENDLAEELSTASPAIANGAILIRSVTGLYCIEQEVANADSPAGNV